MVVVRFAAIDGVEETGVGFGAEVWRDGGLRADFVCAWRHLFSIGREETGEAFFGLGRDDSVGKESGLGGIA